MTELFSHEYFMKKALQEAEIAFEKGEIPVGAIIVAQDKIIGRGHNLTEQLTDVTAHAEIQAITAASQYLNGKYLRNCKLYVTLEPCCMCAGALYWSQIDEIYVGAKDLKRGFSNFNVPLHPKTRIKFGVLAGESLNLIQKFFKNKRK